MNTRRAFKNELFRQLARIAGALASPRRLELVDLLAQSERSVEELAGLTGMSVANTSQHLQALRRALLVDVRRDGQRSFYSLADDGVFETWQAIRDLGSARLAEVDRLLDQFVEDRDQLQQVRADELRDRIEDDAVVVLDVRPSAEFRSGHIAGARSIPIEELERRLGEIEKDREVVAYCRGPFCVYADEAVSMLRREGFQARRLDVGFPDWKSSGLPVEVERGGAS